MPAIESERWVRYGGAHALRIRYTDGVEVDVHHGVFGALVVSNAPEEHREAAGFRADCLVKLGCWPRPGDPGGPLA